MFKLRPGTLDEYIFDIVTKDNEYGLPPSFRADDIVVDIGAHIGTFAYAALTRGARNVHCVEADRENMLLLLENLQNHVDAGWLDVTHGAAWRSDDNTDELSFHGYPHFGAMVNTGGGRVLLGSGGTSVPKISFDAYLQKVTKQQSSRVRFLKLDCEGSEWPILFTSRLLHLVDQLAAEVHEGRVDRGEGLTLWQPFQHLSVDDLTALLTGQGFSVEYFPTSLDIGDFKRLGLLYAVRTGCGR